MPKQPDRPKKVGEALVEYRVQRSATGIARGRLSSKNQLTLPVSMCRKLDIRPGDEIELMVEGNTIVLERLPRTPEEWLKSIAGSLNVPEWSTDEKINAWVNAERDSWDREWDPDSSAS